MEFIYITVKSPAEDQPYDISKIRYIGQFGINSQFIAQKKNNRCHHRPPRDDSLFKTIILDLIV